jgi:hypothetical protein
MSDAATGAEKRQATRYSCAGDAEIVVPGRGLHYTGRIVDLSAGGCFVETTCRLERGTSVELWMSTRGLPLRLAANLVVRRHNGIGFRFHNVVPRKLELIRMLTAELAEEQCGQNERHETPKQQECTVTVRAETLRPRRGLGTWLRSLGRMNWIRGWLD